TGRAIPRLGGVGGSKSRDFATIMPTEPRPAAASTRAGPNTTAKVRPVERPNMVRLEEVAGCDEAKLELSETIEFLRTPERFRRLGARIPPGIMLFWAPGTGKTMF